MIQINLSEKQARELLEATGWGNQIPRHIEVEIFRQLEHKLMPPSTNAAELAVFKHEAGYTGQAVEGWKLANDGGFVKRHVIFNMGDVK